MGTRSQRDHPAAQPSSRRRRDVLRITGIDDDGFLQLLDRKKDVIISGGFNVYAVDLEAVLSKHPNVTDAAVIGVPSDRWGETPMGLVVVADGSELSEKSLCEWANSQLGKNQRLACVEIRDALPRNAIGKVLKRQLRDPYWEGRADKIS